MRTIQTAHELDLWRALRRGTCGFVPTMGYLHEGHASLVRRARQDCNIVAVSIFVNPSQFGPGEDLASYPRDLPHDLQLLDGAGADIVFLPDVDLMYPAGFQTWVQVTNLSRPLEGAARPDHFRGVATVVLKLLNLVDPDTAYFGQKDAQQLAVIRRMAGDLALRTQIVGCPTSREPDGLARSSRNSYLNPAERAAATVVYRALCAARDAWRAGVSDASRLRTEMRRTLDDEPLVQVDYVSVADPETLGELEVASVGALALLAVRIGRARLIDNLVLEP